MTMQKSEWLWIVNVVSFLLLAVLALTGAANALLPHGGGPQEVQGFWHSVRSFSVELHEWSGILFLGALAIHLVLHWSYIQINLKKWKILK